MRVFPLVPSPLLSHLAPCLTLLRNSFSPTYQPILLPALPLRRSTINMTHSSTFTDRLLDIVWGLKFYYDQVSSRSESERRELN